MKDLIDRKELLEWLDDEVDLFSDADNDLISGMQHEAKSIRRHVEEMEGKNEKDHDVCS